MRITIMYCAVAALLASCGKSSNETTENSDSTSVDNRYSYSSSFTMADPSHLEIVRNWNNALAAGNFDQAFSYFADSVDITLSDGTRYNSTRDSISTVVRQILSSITNLKVVHIAGISVTSTDRNQDWVLSYTDESYDVDGKTNRHIAHEVYQIVNGKIRNIYAYAQQPSSFDQPGTEVGNPYTYSGSFEILGTEYLDLKNAWYDAYLAKNYEEGKNYFADSLTAIFDDGSVIDNTQDSILNLIKELFSEAEINLEQVAAIAVRSTDRNEEWILSWYNEKITTPEGVTEGAFHEVYRVVDKKIREARIFKQAIPKE